MVSMKKIIIFYIFFQVFEKVCLFEGRQIRTPIRQNQILYSPLTKHIPYTHISKLSLDFPINVFEQFGKSTL